MVVLRGRLDEARLAEREMCEQNFGSVDHSPGLPSGLQTRNRDHSDATRLGLRGPEAFRYLLFFVSYFLSETDRLFSVLHNGCHVIERTSVSCEGALVQRLRAVQISWTNSIGFPKGHFGVELSTRRRVPVGKN